MQTTCSQSQDCNCKSRAQKNNQSWAAQKVDTHFLIYNYVNTEVNKQNFKIDKLGEEKRTSEQP